MAKTLRMMCTIQDKALTNRELKQIEKQSNQLYTQYFGQGFKVLAIWIRIPSGQAYLAGKPSRASAVIIPVPDELDDKTRHAFMKDFCKAWMDITGCDKNQIIFNAADLSYANKLSQQMLTRIRVAKRPFVAGKILLRLVISKVTRGYLTMPINL